MESPKQQFSEADIYQGVPTTIEELALISNFFKGNLEALSEARQNGTDNFHEKSLDKYFTDARDSINNLRKLEQQYKNMSPNNFPPQPPMAMPQNYQPAPLPQPSAPQYPVYPQQVPPAYPPQPQQQDASVQWFMMIYNELQKVNNTLAGLTNAVNANTDELKKLKKSEKTANPPRQPSIE